MNKNYMKSKVENNMLVQKLREGYIGKTVYSFDGTSYVQSSRSPAYGYVVAYFNKSDNKIYYGLSYFHKDDTYFDDRFGYGLAVKRAMKNSDMGVEDSFSSGNNPFVKSKDKSQIEFFKRRAMKFFMPEKYSFSGSEPLKEDEDKFKHTHLCRYFNDIEKNINNKEKVEFYIRKLRALLEV